MDLSKLKAASDRAERINNALKSGDDQLLASIRAEVAGQPAARPNGQPGITTGDLKYFESRIRKDAKTGKAVTYWDQKIQNRSDAGYQAKLTSAEKEGKANAERIINSAKDLRSQDHESARAKLNQLGENGIYNKCIKDAMEAKGVEPNEHRNEAYEANVLKQYHTKDGRTIGLTAHNSNDVYVLDKFKRTICAKWAAVGPKNDAEFVANFFSQSNNKLSQFTESNPAPGK